MKKTGVLIFVIVFIFLFSVTAFAGDGDIDSYKDEFSYDDMISSVDSSVIEVLNEMGITEVSYETPQESKQALGHLAYMLEGLRRLSKLTSYHAIVEYDDGVIEDDFLFGAATNTTSVAGLVRLGSDNTCVSDGVFEVLLVRKPKDILDLGDIVSSILSNDFSGENILFFKSRELRVMFDQNVAWTRDGEDGGICRDAYIQNCRPGVEIIV